MTLLELQSLTKVIIVSAVLGSLPIKKFYVPNYNKMTCK